MNKIDGGSLDVEHMERERLKSVFPQCFVEGKLDIDKLLNLCGEYIDNDFEKYKFEWHGKGEALKLAQRRSMGALRPCVEESVDWDTTENLYIEGDNLEVLKLLQTAYYAKVKMIYIDPPYNTGNDFVYEDDFKDPLNRYKEVTSQTTKSNPETMGRFHTNWLNMIYPRLRLAANLLTDDGVIFISIDDNEVHNLRKMCDEVFGEENFVEQFNWFRTATPPNLSKKSKKNIEYILCYEKSRNSTKYKGVKKESKSDDPFTKPQNSEKNLEFRAGSINIKGADRIIPKGIYGTEKFPNVLLNDLIVRNGKNENSVIFKNRFIWLQEKLDEELDNCTRVNLSMNGVLSYKKADYDEEVPPNLIDDNVGVSTTEEAGKALNEMLGNKIFDYPKPLSLIKYLANFVVNNDDIILDFFSGSGTTAHAVMQLNAEDGGNRKFICVQLPEMTDESSEAYKAGYKNICEIGKERIRRAGKKVFSSELLVVSDKTVNSSELFVFSEDQQLKTKDSQLKTDIGFKVFKLDTSNLKTWDASPIDSSDPAQIDLFMERLSGMIETIKPDRSDVDMVYEVMLKMGIPLTYPVKEVVISSELLAVSDEDKELKTNNSQLTTKAYSVGEDCLLLICLQEGLTTETIETMASDYLPSKLVLSEKCFADDTAMANAHYILKEREIELKLV